MKSFFYSEFGMRFNICISHLAFAKKKPLNASDHFRTNFHFPIKWCCIFCGFHRFFLLIGIFLVRLRFTLTFCLFSPQIYLRRLLGNGGIIPVNTINVCYSILSIRNLQTISHVWENTGHGGEIVSYNNYFLCFLCWAVIPNRLKYSSTVTHARRDGGECGVDLHMSGISAASQFDALLFWA